MGEDRPPMRGYQRDTYGERIADIYDRWHPDVDTGPAVDFLANLAGSGTALELGIGTGRLALALAARGIEVHGIDSSPAMIERLRAKEGGDRITVTVGDFAAVDVDRDDYQLIFVTFNTFWMLLTQDEQVSCFANAAARLRPGGTFLIEGSVPDPAALARREAVDAFRVEADLAVFDLTMRDIVAQRMDRQQVIVDKDGVRLQPLSFRYVWPSEMDLMARLAGLRLRKRFGGWQHEHFNSDSSMYVAVYERPKA
jgi:SAM-dependent methyltransferase